MLKRIHGACAIVSGRPQWSVCFGRRVRTTRLSNHSVGLQQDVSCGEIRILDTLQHGCHRHRTNIRAILVLGGQRDGEKTRILHVIDANDPHLLRHAHSLACKTRHHSGCDEIVRTDDGFRPALLQELPNEIRIVRVASTNKILLEVNAAREQSFAIAGYALGNGRGR